MYQITAVSEHAWYLDFTKSAPPAPHATRIDVVVEARKKDQVVVDSTASVFSAAQFFPLAFYTPNF